LRLLRLAQHKKEKEKRRNILQSVTASSTNSYQPAVNYELQLKVA
jgi:hypothetical protein